MVVRSCICSPACVSRQPWAQPAERRANWSRLGYLFGPRHSSLDIADHTAITKAISGRGTAGLGKGLAVAKLAELTEDSIGLVEEEVLGESR